MFITNESMQVLKAGKATFAGSHKVGQMRKFKCSDGSETPAMCVAVFTLNPNLPVAEFIPLSRFTQVHVSEIKPGDTIFHRDGHLRTVCKSNIKYDSFIGWSLFGDSYKLGTILVRKLI